MVLPCGCRVHHDADNVINVTPKLADAAFAVARRNLWELTRLPRIISEYAYRAQCNVLTQKSVYEYGKKVESELGKIETLLMQFTFLPYRLKVKILTSIVGLNQDFMEFLRQLTLEKPTKKSLAYCIKCTILTQSGTIDIKKSILNILRQSQFKVQFSTHFLERHCIRYDDVIKVYRTVLRSELARIAMLKRKKIQKVLKSHLRHNLKIARQYIDNTLESYEYWAHMSRRISDDYYIPEHATMLQCLAILGSVDVIKHFDSPCMYNYEIRYRYHELRLAAKLMFIQDIFDVNKTKYFHNHLPEEMWDKLLESYAVNIFLAYFGSWIYRCHSIEVFNTSKKYFVNHNYMLLLRGIVEICLLNKYQYYDMRPIIELIWANIPKCIKNEPEVYLTMIPQLVLLQRDFEILNLMLKSYNMNKQRKILTIIIFGLIIKKESNHIEFCLKVLEDVIIIKDYKTLLNMESFKDFLIFDAKTDDNHYNNLDLVAKMICNKTLNINNLKKQMRDDKNLIVSMLSVVSCNKDFCMFLSWLLKTKVALITYQNRLFAKEWVHEAYHIRLMTFELSEANELFSIMNVSDVEKVLIEQSVKKNTVALNFLLASCLEAKQATLNFFLKSLFTDKTEARQFIEDFLSSDLGRTTITELFTRIQTVENDISFRYLAVQKMLKFSEFIDDWIRPTGLMDRMRSYVRELKQNVLTWPLNVEDCQILPADKKLEARHIAIAQYLGFRILLQRKFDIFELVQWNHLTMTRLCVQLIRDYNISIDLD